jgi:hypothetical protein
MVKKKLRISFLALVSFCTMHARYGRLMIFIDDGEPMEYDQTIKIPILMDCIQALYEKTGPVLVTAYMWNNIMGRYRAFTEKKNVSGSSEETYYELYRIIVDYMETEIASIPDKNKKDLNAITKELQRMVGSKLAQDQAFLEKREKFAQDKDFWSSSYKGCIYTVIHFFDFSQWHIYTIDDTWYLFVPRTYQQNMEKKYKTEIDSFFPPFKRSISFIHDVSTKRVLEKEEIAMGLKIHNFKKVTRSQWAYFLSEKSVLEPKKHVSTTSIHREDLSNRLFVTYDDVGNKAVAQAILPYYTIFLAGHGQYMSSSKLLEIALKKTAALQNDIGFFVQGQITDFPERKQKKIAELMELEQKIMTMISQSNGLIAGLSMKTYMQFLDFLNDHISTNMLYYSCCFGGGTQYQLAFVTRGVGKEYNYTIMSQVSADIVSSSAMPYFYVLWDEKMEVINEKERATARLALTSEINFVQFFDAVEKKRSLNTIIKQIAYESKTNIPAIRLPGTSWFNAARLKDVVYITNVALGTTKNFDVSGKKAVLLYTPAIFSTITMDLNEKNSWENALATAQRQASGQLPLFISMAPEQMTHWIWSLQACNCLLTAVVYNFLKALTTRIFKSFLIDSLCVENNLGIEASTLLGIDEDQTITLTNVLIFNILMPRYDSKQGMLFTWNEEGYIANYITDKGKIICESIDPEQKIQKMTTEQFNAYNSLYQRDKTSAQEYEKFIPDVADIEKFVRRHVGIVKNLPMSEEEKAWKTRKGLGEGVNGEEKTAD